MAPENLVAVRALAEIQELLSADAEQTSHARPKPDADPDWLKSAPSAHLSMTSRAVEVVNVTSAGAIPEIQLKPDAPYDEAMPDVQLNPDDRYDEAMPELELKPVARYDRTMPEAEPTPGATYGESMPGVQLHPDVPHEDRDTNGHAVRTLAALGGLLAAIHATRAHRSA